jgi:hypothetical protein
LLERRLRRVDPGIRAAICWNDDLLKVPGGCVHQLISAHLGPLGDLSLRPAGRGNAHEDQLAGDGCKNRGETHEKQTSSGVAGQADPAGRAAAAASV